MANGNWNKFYANGENPNGFRALTPNGTATDQSAGENHQYPYGPNINGPRWEMAAPDYPMGIAFPSAVRGQPGSGRSGNRNRSGE